MSSPGHSFGELVALYAAESSLSTRRSRRRSSDERGRLMLAALGDEPGSMAAIASRSGRGGEA